MDNEKVTVAAETAPAAPAAQAAPAAKPYRNGNNVKRHKKVCIFCQDKIEHIDFKDTKRLTKCVSERGKIYPRRINGCCAAHQRQLTVAVKRARQIALMPYVAE